MTIRGRSKARSSRLSSQVLRWISGFAPALLAVACAFSGPAALALGPMYSFQDLVAGEGMVGLQDGPFYSALFNRPSGITLDPLQRKLYVADTGNNRIRVIDLNHDNQVETLAGTGVAGSAEGEYSAAEFNVPTRILFLPGSQLVVVDQGSHLLRLVDLNAKKVSNLAGNGFSTPQDGTGSTAQIGEVWGLAYSEGERAVYFTEPERGTLRRLSLDSREVKTVLAGDKQIPAPGAICVDKEKIYIADMELPQGAILTPLKGKEGFERDTFNCSSKTLALSWSGDGLYSLQKDSQVPVARPYPTPRPVSFYGIWGEPLIEPGRGWFDSRSTPIQTGGMVCDPAAPRKFYLVQPTFNIVISLRDLHQDVLMGNDSSWNGLMDMEYPEAKPPGVFRILVAGDSHLFHNDNADQSSTDNRMALLQKKLEVNLNTQAALKDAPIRFEVLTTAWNSHFPLNLWPYYSVPPLVKKFDVDLVLLVLQPLKSYLEIYLDRPLTAEHLPQEKPDPETMLKPYKKLALEPGLRPFLDLCLSKKDAILNRDGTFRVLDEYALRKDPDLRPKMVELFSRPLKALNTRIEGMKTKKGKQVRMAAGVIPMAYFQSFLEEKPFWQGVLEAIGCPTVDIADRVTVLRLSFLPLSEGGGFGHYNSHGHELMGQLIAQDLIERKLVPMDKAAPE